MPAPAGSKRVKGVSIHRPFVYGSIAHPIPPPPAPRPPHIPPEHTHRWTVYIRGIDNAPLTYWLKKVQFKLHETYANPLRLIETPPFEVTETGWGEFEVQIKLYFVGESGEKPQTVWHPLKLHPFGPVGEGAGQGQGGEVVSQSYEEVVFNEPVEAFYDVLTGGPVPPGLGGAPLGGQGKKKGGGTAGQQQGGGSSGASSAVVRGWTAEVPRKRSQGNPYSEETEGGELDRMKIAIRKVEEMVGKERERLKEREEVLAELKSSEGIVGGGGGGGAGGRRK